MSTRSATLKPLLSAALLLGALSLTTTMALACGCGGWSPHIQPEVLGRGVVMTQATDATLQQDIPLRYGDARTSYDEVFMGHGTIVRYGMATYASTRQAHAEYCGWGALGPCRGRDVVQNDGATGVTAYGQRGRYFFFITAIGPRAQLYARTLARYCDQLYTTVASWG